MVVKGGTVGLGWSRGEAAADWWREFTEAIARPEHPPLPARDAGMHTASDTPAGEHPPV